jgi:hypothetical protein
MPERKISITLRVDPDVLAWFKREGGPYQTRVNAVLRAYMRYMLQLRARENSSSKPGRLSRANPVVQTVRVGST